MAGGQGSHTSLKITNSFPGPGNGLEFFQKSGNVTEKNIAREKVHLEQNTGTYS